MILSHQKSVAERPVRIAAGRAMLDGDLRIPASAAGVVLFAHGSGSSRHSPRNRFVAQQLGAAGFASLLLDLLTADEEEMDAQTAHVRFDISLLAQRLVGAVDWLARNPETAALPIGCFGASTGAAAALVAATERPRQVNAVVSRGGRPDLASDGLPIVQAPTLLIVGADDIPVIGLNRRALQALGAPVKELKIVPGATHLFEEPGKLEEVATMATDWFNQYLRRRASGSAGA